jgi:hypothetical protein
MTHRDKIIVTLAWSCVGITAAITIGLVMMGVAG